MGKRVAESLYADAQAHDGQGVYVEVLWSCYFVANTCVTSSLKTSSS